MLVHGLLTGVTLVGTGDWVLDVTVGRGTGRDVVGIGTAAAAGNMIH